MPEMDGFATMNRLNELNYDIPVLFLTGAGTMDYAVKAIHLGVYDFLTKPIEDLDIFNVKIRRAIEKIFKVRVADVKTMQVKGKVKRRGRVVGKRKDWKKAIVKLMPGERIDFFEGV